MVKLKFMLLKTLSEKFRKAGNPLREKPWQGEGL
jgi:hypothetical protein